MLGAHHVESQALENETRLGFDLHHLSPVIGTEVLGIDLGQPLGDEVIDFLQALLVERKVIFFRDQPLTVEQHIAFAARFGELEVHPFASNDDTYPELIHLDNGPGRPPIINIWHSDVTWRECPSLGSVLRARQVPEVGGDTLFANMEAAYDALPQDTKALIDGLVAVHDNTPFLEDMRAGGASEEEIEAKRREFPPMRHPVVRTHPVSGRKSLYVNSAFTRYIEGMDSKASDLLLAQLYQQAGIPDFQCRFRWRADSLAFWDNRGAQHYAAADYYPAVRKMERVTVIGDRPV